MGERLAWINNLLHDAVPAGWAQWFSLSGTGAQASSFRTDLSPGTLSHLLTWFALDTDTAITVTDSHAVVQWVNPAYTRLTGFATAEVIGGRVGRVQQGPETSSEALEEMRKALIRGQPCNVQMVNYTKSGTAYWADIEARPIRNQRGGIDHYIITQKDITHSRQQTRQLEQAKQAAEQLASDLAASRGQLRMAADAGGLSLWDWDLAGDRFWISSLWIPVANEQWIENCGLRDLFTLAHEDDFPRIERTINRLLSPNPPQISEQFRMLIAGKWRWVNFRGAVSAVDGQGRATRVSGTLMDETERKQNDERMQAHRELLQSVIQHIPHAVFWKDDQCRYLGCNGRFVQTLGLQSVEQVVGRTDFELRATSKEAARIAAADQEIVTSGCELIAQPVMTRMPDGARRDWLISKVPLRNFQGKVFGMLGIFNDITEQKRLERQLSDAHQLESLGRLAAGIAHEINTPMQYISDNVEFLSDSTNQVFELLDSVQAGLSNLRQSPSAAATGTAATADRPTVADLGLADKRLAFIRQQVPKAIHDCAVGARRVMEIVSAMRVFSHPGSSSYVTAHVNDLIDSTVSLTRNRWKYCADLKLELAEDLPPIRCLPTEINQVILNLLVNAADAVTERFGENNRGAGQITIRTSRSPGGVTIEIIDNGCGIPEENQSRIFNPFFTTKEVGKGTGQGLTLCYGVVCNKHGGTLTLESRVGEGTIFRVFLPDIACPMSSEAARTLIPMRNNVC